MTVLRPSASCPPVRRVIDLPAYQHSYYDYQDCRFIMARFASLGCALPSAMSKRSNV